MGNGFIRIIKDNTDVWKGIFSFAAIFSTMPVAFCLIVRPPEGSLFYLAGQIGGIILLLGLCYLIFLLSCIIYKKIKEIWETVGRSLPTDPESSPAMTIEGNVRINGNVNISGKITHHSDVPVISLAPGTIVNMPNLAGEITPYAINTNGDAFSVTDGERYTYVTTTLSPYTRAREETVELCDKIQKELKKPVETIKEPSRDDLLRRD